MGGKKPGPILEASLVRETDGKLKNENKLFCVDGKQIKTNFKIL